MSLRTFLGKHRAAASGPVDLLADGVSQLSYRINGDERGRPVHVPDQYDLIGDFFNTDEEVWLFFLDAGRYDFFDRLVWDYFDGDLQRCWNGGVGYTGDWTVRNLTRDFGRRGLFSWVPLRGFGAAEYDGRRHFYMAPDIQQETDVNERLAALGYRERTTDEDISISPDSVNAAVRDHQGRLNGGVVRYLKPHPPFDGLDDITSESTKTQKTWDALRSGALSFESFVDAYEATYRRGLAAAADLAADLDGRIVITADHGTCLGDCGQLFHGRRLDKHDHLTVVPWFEVDR